MALNLVKTMTTGATAAKGYGHELGNVTNRNKEFNKSLKQADPTMKALHKNFDSLKQQASKLKGGIMGLASSFSGGLIAGGLTASILGLIKTSFDFGKTMVGWHNQMNYLSSSTGDTTQAVNTMISSWNKSIASMSDVQATMKSLSQYGMQAGKQMENLTVFISSLSQATGISADTMGQMTGQLTQYWKVSVQGSKEIASSFIAAQDAFKLSTAQIEQIMKVSIEAQDKLGAFFMDGEKSAKALAKGIAMAGAAITSFGVNAQTASSFLDKMMDPSKFQETNVLMRQLGISFEEQMKMMESGEGKEMFFDKLMTNLPKLSQQIQNISNPLARMQYAQAIGLPPEIAQKLATASAGKMQQVIQEYKDKAKDDDAAKKKLELAKKNQARFDEAVQLWKMQVLMPLIDWTMKAWNKIMALRNELTPKLQNLSSMFVQFLEYLEIKFKPIVDALMGGKGAKQVLGEVFKSVFKILGDALHLAMKNLPWQVWALLIARTLGGMLLPMFGQLLMSKGIGGAGSGILSLLGKAKGVIAPAAGAAASGLGLPGTAAGAAGLGAVKAAGGVGGALKVAGTAGLGAVKAAGGAIAGTVGAITAPVAAAVLAAAAVGFIGYKAFKDKEISEADKREIKYLNDKRDRGERLTKAEIKREEQLLEVQLKAKTSLIDGFKNLFSAQFWKDLGKEISTGFFNMIDKIRIAWFNLTYGLELSLHKLGSFFNGSFFHGQGEQIDFLDKMNKQFQLGIESENKDRGKRLVDDAIKKLEAQKLKQNTEEMKAEFQSAIDVMTLQLKTMGDETKKVVKHTSATASGTQQVVENTKKEKAKREDFLQAYVATYGLASVKFST